jgi:hypothetical protein
LFFRRATNSSINSISTSTAAAMIMIIFFIRVNQPFRYKSRVHTVCGINRVTVTRYSP